MRQIRGHAPASIGYALAVLFVSAGCAPETVVRDTGLGWVGTTTTEGGTTRVVTTSGSVWGGEARLLEEASIGVDAGADEYMLGSVGGIAATADRIFVIDQQVPALRVYDHGGTYLRDLGGPGQGPGEFERPSSVAVAADGRVFLRDDRARRISVYGGDGGFIEQYVMPGGLNTSTPMVLSSEGVPYTPVFVDLRRDDPNRMFVIAMQGHGQEGAFGEQLVPPIDETFVPGVASDATGSVQRPVPFFPEEHWAMGPDLAMLFGVSNEYRFERRARDGSTLVIEKSWEPVPVEPDEADWHRRETTAIMQSVIPDWIWGETPTVPSHKPAFSELIPTHSGEIWVLRPGPGSRLPECDPDAETADDFDAFPCWRDQRIVDVFAPDGRFLGSITPPPEMRFTPRPHIDGDLVVARTEDENAVSRVKRYRLIRPDGAP